MPTTLTILLFDDAEVLDVMGPFEAFSLATTNEGSPAFTVQFAAREPIVSLRNGLRVVANRPLSAPHAPGILLVPGGPGVRRLLDDQPLLEWIQQGACNAELVLSVCTGAWLLGRAGLLDGRRATTHHKGFDDLERLAPRCTVVRASRFVDADPVMTSAGVSAGVDLSLHVIAKRLGAASRDRVATIMEWPSTHG